MSGHLGIDYGAKLSGNTVICLEQKKKLLFIQCEKKKDADQFLAQAFKELSAQQIFFDAPLSIPAAYFGEGENFHYRACDRETSAMSPMFLGGLTARAMKLKNDFPAIDFHETYPAYFVKKILNSPPSYNKKTKNLLEFTELLMKTFSVKFDKSPENWHQIDAAICWISGKRYNNQEQITVGRASEGLIVI